MNGGRLRPHQGYVETETESEFTGEESISIIGSESALESESAVDECPPGVESGSALESESASEVTDYTEDESDVPRYRKTTRFSDDEGELAYEIPGPSKRYKTTHPRQRKSPLESALKRVVDLVKAIAFLAAVLAIGLGSLALVTGILSSITAAVKGDFTVRICNRGPTSAIAHLLTICNLPSEVSALQSGIRAQAGIADLQNINALTDDVHNIMAQVAGAMDYIMVAIGHDMPPRKAT